jgi:hypothetical protein
MSKKYYWDFFIYNKKLHWFLIPTIVFYYHKTEQLHVNESLRTFGLTIRFLTYMIGIQLEQELNEETNL